jgi:small GTP-binding protein
MATKKSGKSVIVNSFLENEYAPSSFELATPNSIIYKCSNKNSIVLKYKDIVKEFDNADSIRNYVEEVYKRTETDLEIEETVEDMYIQYNNEKQNLDNFTIIDTPGPDLAGSNHREIAYKWIERADIVVFVIDYSMYLTDAEENYLRDIKSFFDKYDKSHSLIVVVNKIDLMYASGGKNSVVRFLDFLRFKLKELGYRGVVVVAVSALQYFSAVRVPRLKGCEHLNDVDSERLTSELGKCKSLYSEKKEMSVIRTLQNYISDLEDYQGIKDADLNRIKEKSGMLRMMDYTNYVTTRKANVELFKAVMRKIDDRYASIKNYLFSFQSNYLTEAKMLREKQKENVLLNMRRVYQMIEACNAKMREILDFTELINEVHSECNMTDNGLLKVLNGVIHNEIRVIRKALRFNGDDVLKAIIEGNTVSISSKLQTNFYKFLCDSFNEKAGNCQRKVNAALNRKQEQLSLMDKEIRESIGLYNDYLDTSLQGNSIKIILPKLELAFSRETFDFTKVDSKVIIEVQDILKRALHQKHGVIGRLMQLATLNLMDRRFGKYELDYESIDEMLYSILDNIKNEVICAIKENNEKIFTFVSAYLNEELQPKIADETDTVINNYRSFILQAEEAFISSEADLKNNINLVQQKISFMEKSKGTLQLFFEAWERIREQADDSKRSNKGDNCRTEIII